MYCVVYEFQVVPEKSEIFEKSWAEYTEAIYRVRGSLGSRLHKTSNPNTYVAYAQWPSRDVFESTSSDDLYTTDELKAREAMKDSMVSSKVVYTLDTIDDRLRRT